MTIVMSSSIGFDMALINVEATLKNVETISHQRCNSIEKKLSNVEKTVVLILCNVENPTSDFVSLSTSNQRYYNVCLQR